MKEIALRYRITMPMLKKYVGLLETGQLLPGPDQGGQPRSLATIEEEALSGSIQMAQRVTFRMSKAMIVNTANFLHAQRLQPAGPVSRNWFSH